ncbi:Chemotaxis protein methyltransferase CheR [Minicystis rosea]|nr:Chemotaxis protein methyltransferase CheR [Minicystis rosea]
MDMPGRHKHSERRRQSSDVDDKHPRASASATDFRAFFESLPECYLVVDDGMTMVAASEAFLRSRMVSRDAVIGHKLFEVFPDNPEDPHATGIANLRASIERVFATGKPDTMAVQEYHIRRPEAEGGGFAQRWYSPTNSPVFGAEHELKYVIHRGEDVTDFILLKQEEDAQHKVAEEQRSRAERMEAEVYVRAQDIQRANADLRVANEKLSRLDELKTRFFANVSHEFRTPLTLMLGPAQALLEGVHGPLDDAQQREVEVLQRNARRLLKLVNSLLDLSRIEAARMEVAYEPTDLATLTAELASAFRALIEQAGLTLVVDCPKLPEPIAVDREMWEKIVLNLLSNAFKFTFHGTISVSLRWGGDHVELAVRDTGTGIPEAELPRVFERFHRVQRARGRTHEGSGIGLALVRELVGFHHGSIRVASVPGEGSTFSVRVPAGTSHLPVERIGAERELGLTATSAAAFVEEASHWVGAQPRMDEGSQAAPQAAGEAGGRVLLVEDNADMRGYITRLLSPRYEVEAVADGLLGLAAARACVPDLVVTDVMMPGLDGFGLLRALRADPRTQTVPVMMLSARAGEEARVEGVELGADDYLVKPFSPRELLARVGARIELARLRRQVARETERLRESEARFRAVADAAPVMIWLSDPSGACEYVNATWARLTRQTSSQSLGDGWLDVVHPDDRARAAETFRAAVAGRSPFTMEYRIQVVDGTYRWILDHAVSRPSESGEYLGHVGSCIDIDERKRAEEIKTEAERRKDEFLAMLAHELRNPLAPMRLALHLLRMQTSGAAMDRHLQILERQTNNLARLVDDLLDVSRVTRGKIQLRMERVEVATVVTRALEATRGLCESRRHHVTVALPDEPIVVFADAVRLEQILVNLITNAAKYTDPGGHLDVRVRRDGDRVEMSVKDDGIGIAKHMLDRVWNLFQQAERSLDRAQGGLGIGLSIVRRLVELHGGTTEARSPGLGGGSTFFVWLPIAAAEPVTPPKDDVDTARARAAARKLRVLIVDDNVDAATTLGELVRGEGHDVRLAHDGPTALVAAGEQRPEIVFLDIGLPGMDGYEVARRLRAAGPRAAKLVALTGYGQEADRKRAAEAGFAQHLVKPALASAVLDLLAGA